MKEILSPLPATGLLISMFEKISFGIIIQQDVQFTSITDSLQTVVLQRHRSIQKKS